MGLFDKKEKRVPDYIQLDDNWYSISKVETRILTKCVDKVTGVVYICYNSSGYGSKGTSMCPEYNSDGSVRVIPQDELQKLIEEYKRT